MMRTLYLNYDRSVTDGPVKLQTEHAFEGKRIELTDEAFERALALQRIVDNFAHVPREAARERLDNISAHLLEILWQETAAIFRALDGESVAKTPRKKGTAAHSSAPSDDNSAA